MKESDQTKPSQAIIQAITQAISIKHQHQPSNSKHQY
jgi:hypothetical protein